MLQTILEKLQNENIFIEASAGTGKTYTIVEIVTKLLENGHNISRMGIITFTEKAAGELLVRIRTGIETKLKDPNLENKLHFEKQLEDLPFANIGTIHNFCRNLLSKYPEASDFFPFKQEERSVSHRIAKAFQIFLEKKEKEAIETKSEETFIQFFLDFDVSNLQEFCEEIIYKVQFKNISPPEEITQENLNSEFNSLLTEILEEYPQSILGRYRNQNVSKELFDTLVNNKLLTQKYGLNKTKNRDLKDKLDYFQIQEKLKALVQFLNDWIRFYKGYQKEENFLSTDDIIHTTANMLKDHPKVRKTLSADFDFLIVDECQDTDPTQFLILSMLCSTIQGDKYKVPKLILVGDKKQSIYKFRNADLKTVEFYIDKLIPKANRLKLDTSYRSTQSLNKFFNKFFSINNLFSQFEYSEVKTGRTDELANLPNPTVLFTLFDPIESKKAKIVRIENAESIVAFIQEIYKNENYLIWDKYQGTKREILYSDIAILANTGKELKIIQNSLLLHNVPCSTYKEKDYYEENLVASLSYMLHAIENPNDNQSFLFCLDSPLFLIPVSTLSSLASENLLNYYEVALPNTEEYKELKKIYELFSKAHEERYLYPASFILQSILEKMNTIPRLASGFEGRKNLTNLYYFYDILNEMQYNQNMSFGELAREMRRRVINQPEAEKRLDYEEREQEQDTVKLMTIHASKGLEFPVCVLFTIFKTLNAAAKPRILKKKDFEVSNGKVEIEFSFKSNAKIETLNYKSALEEDKKEDNEEEARRLYVALTRARDYLFLPLNFANSYITPFSKTLRDLLHKNSTFVKECLKNNLAKVFETKREEVLQQPISQTSEEKTFSFPVQELEDKWNRAIQTIPQVASWNIVSYSKLHYREHQRQETPKETQEPKPQEFQFGDADAGRIFGQACHSVLEQAPFEKVGNQNFLKKDLVELCKQTYADFGLNSSRPEYSLETLITLTHNALTYNYTINNKSASIPKWKYVHKERKFYSHGERLGDWILGVGDVLFMFKDKYYILDWKTDQQVGESVEAHCKKEYIYQAYLYSFILLQNISQTQKEHSLEKIYDKKFGGMLFVFLRHLGTKNGVYHIKPTLGEVLRFVKG